MEKEEVEPIDEADGDIRTAVNANNITERRPPLLNIQKYAAFTMLLSFVIMFMTYANLGPFLPPEAEKRNIRPTMVGVIFSIYPGVMVFGCPAIGLIIPKFGSKVIFLIGLILLGSCYIIFSLASLSNEADAFTYGCLTIRFIEGIAASGVLTGFFSITLEYFNSHITEIFAAQQYAVGIGSVAGPFLGSFLYRYGGILCVFTVFGVLIFLTVPVNFYCLSKLSKQANSRSGNGRRAALRILLFPEILVTSLVVIVSGSLFGFIFPTLEPAINKFNLSTFALAMFFSSISISYSVMCIVWALVMTRWGGRIYYAAFGLILCAVTFLLLGPSPYFSPLEMSEPLVLCALTLIGIFSAMHLVPTLEMMHNAAAERGYTDDATYGLISGIWSSSISIGESIGPLYATALVEHHSFPIATSIQALILFCAGLIVFSLIAFKIVQKNRKPGSTPADAMDMAPISEGQTANQTYDE